MERLRPSQTLLGISVSQCQPNQDPPPDKRGDPRDSTSSLHHPLPSDVTQTKNSSQGPAIPNFEGRSAVGVQQRLRLIERLGGGEHLEALLQKCAQSPGVECSLQNLLGRSNDAKHDIWPALATLVARYAEHHPRALADVLEASVAISNDSELCRFLVILAAYPTTSNTVVSNPLVEIPKLREDLRLIQRADPYGAFTPSMYELCSLVTQNSKFSEWDLSLVLKTQSSEQPITAQELKEFYSRGNRYIYNQLHLSSEIDGTAAHVAELIRSAHARHQQSPMQDLYPPLDAAGAMIAICSKLELGPNPYDLNSILYSFGPLDAGAKLAILHIGLRQAETAGTFEPVGAALGMLKGGGQRFGIAQLIAAISGWAPHTVSTGLDFVHDISRDFQDELPHWNDLLKTADLSEISRQLYSRRLTAHQRKFPERPLADVLASFRAKSPEYREPPTPALLKRAEILLNICESRHQELLHQSTPALLRAAKLLSQEDENRGTTQFTAKYFALAREVFKRTYGVYPYNTQMLAALMLADDSQLTPGQRGG
ncbi:MAG: hypothetical protein EBZ48_04825, partial [Proteobacteria bacterium]|nr:hypothetical protein [Pseudomonadota bacterium]